MSSTAFAGMMIVILILMIAAGFLVALTGTMMRMPALPKVPSAERIQVSESGEIKAA